MNGLVALVSYEASFLGFQAAVSSSGSLMWTAFCLCWLGPKLFLQLHNIVILDWDPPQPCFNVIIPLKALSPNLVTFQGTRASMSTLEDTIQPVIWTYNNNGLWKILFLELFSL